jgi:hypothetical protein
VRVHQSAHMTSLLHEDRMVVDLGLDVNWKQGRLDDLRFGKQEYPTSIHEER